MAKVRARIGTMALLITLSMSSVVMADPLTDELQGQNSKLTQYQDQLKQSQTKADDLESQMEQLDSQITDAMIKIDDNNKQILESENKITDVEAELKKANADIAVEKDLYDRRIRTMYITGIDGYLDAIIGVKSLSELESRIEAVRTIMKYDNGILDNLNNKKDDIEKKQQELIDENKRLVSLKADNEEKLAKLNEEKDQESQLLTEIKQEEAYFSLSISSSKEQIDSLMKQINEASSNVTGGEVSRGATAINVNDILAYSFKFIGTPYLWGGTSPQTGFDCSGFTQYVYGHFGIKLDRVTYDQINDGPAVTKDQLKPGDLVFFGTEQDPHHVGIYLGNNYYIHAPRTGDFIKISEMTRTDFVKGVRVIK